MAGVQYHDYSFSFSFSSRRRGNESLYFLILDSRSVVSRLVDLSVLVKPALLEVKVADIASELHEVFERTSDGRQPAVPCSASSVVTARGCESFDPRL